MKAWIKAHPKVLVALGAAIVASLGAFGIAPEPVQKVLSVIAGVLGLL